MKSGAHTPSSTSNQPHLQAWREEVLTLTTRVVLVLALPAIGLDTIAAFSLEEPWRLLFDLSAFAALILAAFVRQLGFALRTGLLLGTAYVTGFVWLLVSGLVGTGRLYFLLLIPLAALLLGRRGTFLVWLVGLLTIALIYTAFLLEAVPLPLAIVDRMLSPLTLATSWLGQVLVSGVIGTIIILTINRFQQSLQAAEHSRNDLERLNNDLEQRVAERTAALRSSEEQYFSLVEHAGFAIASCDYEGKILLVNEPAAQYLNNHPDTFIGQTLHDIFASEQADDYLQQVRQVIDTGQPVIGEELFFRKDESRWLWISVHPLYDGKDRSRAVQIMAYDITERKQAEEALRESQHFVQQIAETIPGILYVYDMVLDRNVYSNNQITNILGYTAEDIQNMGEGFIATLLHPDDMETVFNNRFAHEHALNGDMQTLEYRMRHADGTWRWIFSREVVFTRTSEGRAQQILGVAYDITERKQAEEALRESQHFVQQIAETIPGVLYVYDLALGSNIYTNNQITNMLGYTAEELQAMGDKMLAKLTHPDDMDKVFNHVLSYEHAQSGDMRTLEYRIRHADGTWHWLFSREVAFTRTSEGRAQQILGVAYDITDRKHAEEQIQFQAQLLDATGQAVYATTPDGTIVYANRATETLYGWPVEDALGTSILDVTLVFDSHEQGYEIMQHLRTGQTWTGEFLAQRRDGTVFPAFVTTVPFYDESGALSHMIGVSADISRLKQTEYALQRRVRQLEVLREVMHHITSELEPGSLLEEMLKQAIELLDASSGQIVLYDSEQNDLEILACANMDFWLVGMRQPLTPHATGHVINTHQSLVIPDYQTWQDRLPQYDNSGAHALLLVPLLAGEQVLGILIIGHSDPTRSFGNDDVELLTLFAQQATVALQNAHLFAEAQRLATIDPLTGLLNRRSFAELAQRVFDQAARYEHPLSVIMLDIDHFKQVNDQFGHLAGDQVLREVASQCLNTLRTVDIVGRYGGEEIVMVLPETASQQAQQVAERLCRNLAATAIATNCGTARLTVSLGVASVAEIETLSLEQMIDRADRALYAAKRAGRNQWRIWEHDLVP
jgi:diguanylate cyclase (GGDEF)-like protein/PAS domain S-box-containing protein